MAWAFLLYTQWGGGFFVRRDEILLFRLEIGVTIDGLEWIRIGMKWSDDGGERRDAMHRERLGVVNISCHLSWIEV